MQILKVAAPLPQNVMEEREIPSDKALVPPLVVRIVDLLVTEKCISDDSIMRVELCLDEAITNAVLHGNKGDFDKKVKVTLFRDDESW